MLRWMYGVRNIKSETKHKIRNEHLRGSVKVAPVTQKITEERLKWNGHVKRRDEAKIILDAPVPGKRRSWRQNTRWKDSCKIYMESVRLKEEDVGMILDRAKWKNDIQNNSGDPRWWQKPDEMNKKIVNKECHMGVPLFYECGVVSAIKLLSSSREPVR